jgi:hypothetical protein
VELLSRWFVPTDSRAAESDDPVNYQFLEGRGRPEPLPKPDTTAAVISACMIGAHCCRLLYADGNFDLIFG